MIVIVNNNGFINLKVAKKVELKSSHYKKTLNHYV